MELAIDDPECSIFSVSDSGKFDLKNGIRFHIFSTEIPCKNSFVSNPVGEMAEKAVYRCVSLTIGQF